MQVQRAVPYAHDDDKIFATNISRPKWRETNELMEMQWDCVQSTYTTTLNCFWTSSWAQNDTKLFADKEMHRVRVMDVRYDVKVTLKVLFPTKKSWNYMHITTNPPNY